MSAPAERVDALGGLDRIEMIAHRRHWSYEQLGDVRAIRDAVAELIERDKVMREVLGYCDSWFSRHSPTSTLINGLGEAEHPMLTCIRVALARVGGDV